MVLLLILRLRLVLMVTLVGIVMILIRWGVQLVVITFGMFLMLAITFSQLTLTLLITVIFLQVEELTLLFTWVTMALTQLWAVFIRQVQGISILGLLLRGGQGNLLANLDLIMTVQ